MPADQAITLTTLGRLAVALAIGLMVGLERGWEQRERHTVERIAGLRTFGVIGLLGGVAAHLGGPGGDALIAAIGFALALVMTAGYWRESAIDRDVSLITAVSALLTYALGALAGRGELLAASSSGVVLAMVLGFRPELHEMVRRIERTELLATFRLLLISVVMLPVLPNRDLGPWHAINLYSLWWMVVLVAGISYVGYFATRLAGPERGLLATGVFGGIASSTAVALAMAHRAVVETGIPQVLAAGATIASAVMGPRMIMIVAAVSPNLALDIAWPLGAATLAALAATAWFAWRAGVERGRVVSQSVTPQNPLDLGMAIRFGFVLAAILIAARVASLYAGRSGLFAVAGLSGLIDVDAISLSVASIFVRGGASRMTAIGAILIAAASNTLLKPTLAIAIGGRAFGVRFLFASLAMMAAGALGLLAVWGGL